MLSRLRHRTARRLVRSRQESFSSRHLAVQAIWTVQPAHATAFGREATVDGQVRTQTLTNYFEVARFCGLDPYEMLRRFRISPALLDDQDATLPSNQVAELLEASADESA